MRTQQGWPLAILALVVLLGSVGVVHGQEVSDEEKIIYSLGYLLSRNVGGVNFTAAEIELIVAGVSDGIKGQDPEFALETYGPKVRDLLMARRTARMEEEKVKGVAFVAEEARKDGAQVLDSGTIFFPVAAGTGDKPDPEDSVTMHYRGTLIDGTEFDSSYKAGEPVTFSLNGVVPCFRDGALQLSQGGKGRLVCPADTAYGDEGRPPMIPGGATLIFEVELVEIIKADAPPAGE